MKYIGWRVYRYRPWVIRVLRKHGSLPAICLIPIKSRGSVLRIVQAIRARAASWPNAISHRQGEGSVRRSRSGRVALMSWKA